MANFASAHDLFFVAGDSQTLSCSSSGATFVASTLAFGTQTRAINLLAQAPLSSTAGVRVKIISPADSVVSSTAGFIVPLNFPVNVKTLPGQVVNAISNNEAAATLVVTELTD